MLHNRFSGMLLAAIGLVLSTTTSNTIAAIYKASPRATAQEPSEIAEEESVTATLEIAGPVTLDEANIKTANEFQAYLKARQAWQMEALKIAIRLDEEGKLFPGTNDDYSTPEKFTPSLIEDMINRHQQYWFPETVLKEMRPAPEPASVASSTKIPMRLTLTNNTEKPVEINDDIYSDMASVDIKVSGPEVYLIPQVQFETTMEIRPGKPVTLKPGESHTITINNLAFGTRGLAGGWVLRGPGQYEIAIEYIGLGTFLSAKTTVDVVSPKTTSEKTESAASEEESNGTDHAQDITTSLKVVGPVVIDADRARAHSEYKAYCEDRIAWNREALEIAERLEKEGKLFPETAPGFVGTSGLRSALSELKGGIISQINANQRLSYPKSVLDELRPHPENVAKPEGCGIEFHLQITNNSKESIHIYDDVYSDVTRVKTTVTGPDTFLLPRQHLAQTHEWRHARSVEVQPGKSHTIVMKRFSNGTRGMGGEWVVLSSGRYELSVEYLYMVFKKATANTPPADWVSCPRATTSFEVEVQK